MNLLLLVALLTVAVFLVRASTAAGDCPLITAGATCIAHADTCLWCPSVQRCSLKCSLRPDNTTCNGDTLCVWAATKGQCVDSCVTQYETAQDCSLGGTTCEWNSDQSICQQNCSAIVDMSICNVVTTCRWSVNRSSCLSNVGTFAIENSVFAAEMNSTTVRPVLIASMRKDLVDLYSNYRNGTIAVIADRISVNATTTRIPFTAPSFYIPWEAWWCIDTNGTWLSDTWSTYTTHGGAGASSVALVVTSFSVSSSVMETDPPSPVPSSSTAPPRSLSHDSMDLSTCVIPAVICSIVAVLAIGTVIGIRWRHNPYAAIHRSPTAGGVTVQRFSQFDHERFRHVDGRVVTRDAAGAKKQRWDATSSVFAAQSQTWPDAAFLDVPRNTQRRVDLRSAWDELTGPLLPAVVETLTDIRVVVEQGEGIVKCDPRLRLMLFRYSNTVRLLAKSDGVECLLVGQPRCLVTSRNGDVLPADPEHKFVEGKRDVNVVKAAFEGSGHCSHVGTNEERKVVFARLVAQDEPSVVLVSEMHTAVERQLGSAVLHGLPSTWPTASVQSAVRLMLKLAPVLLVDEGGRFPPNMDELVTVQALNPLDGGLAQSYGGSWRVRCLSRDTTVLRVLSTLANRFWALPVDGSGGTSDHILYCQCASGGVTFNPLVGRLVGGVRATTPLDDPAHRLLFLSDRSSPDSADSLLLQPAPGQHHQHAASAAGGSLHPSEDDWTASMLLSRTAAAVGSALLL